MDRIEIRNLEVNAIIGTLPLERERRQKLLVDVKLSLDLAAAGRSDALEDTVNYAEIETRLAELASTSQFKLIEGLAGAMGRLLLAYPEVCSAEVAIAKPGGARFAAAVAVVMNFTREA
ncbi:MAG: dihydroneopterin aldolase [Victivallaceae bacterium]|nr:dihydroneopterin aldolase [Victivallaceae bacterium]